MATAMTTHHAHGAMGGTIQIGATRIQGEEKGVLATFVGDLIEDVSQRPLQPAALAKHDIFREHINAMAISYFALILLLIVGSLPVLAYLIAY